MAKKQDLGAIFRKTSRGSAPAADQAAATYDLTGNIKAMGVGLTTGEIEALQDLADKHQLARNALARIAIRHFLREVIEGRIQVADFVSVQVTTTRKPRLP